MEKFDPIAMDKAAENAESVLNGIDRKSVLLVANWFLNWYMKAGYKRLGKLLVAIAKEEK